MSAIDRRMKRLELELGEGAGRLIVVSSGGASEEEIEALLKGAGIVVRPVDQVVHFATIYEDRDGNALPPDKPPAILSVSPQRGSRP